MDVMASITDRVGDLGGYLREQREHARLSVRQLATLAGVSNPYLSQVERGLRNPSAEVLQQIAKGLRISAEALYVRAGILDQENRPDVEAAVSADPHLNDRQRRVLLDIYTSFRSENERAQSERARSDGAQDDAATVVRPPVRRRRTAAATASAASAASAGPDADAAATAPAGGGPVKPRAAKRATKRAAKAAKTAAKRQTQHPIESQTTDQITDHTTDQAAGATDPAVPVERQAVKRSAVKRTATRAARKRPAPAPPEEN
jgi:transcriptional regulator with XRE-family HTH domain